MVLDLLIFIVLCLGGYLLFDKLKIPTAVILGPMFALAAANFCGLSLTVPVYLKAILSIVMGTMMGVRFNLKIRGMLKEIFLAAVYIIVISVVTAQALIYTGLPEAIAVFAALPGGLAELSLVAMSFGADIFAVALLQSTRLLSTMLFIPLLVKKLPARGEQDNKKDSAESLSRRKWVILFILAITSAGLLGMLHVPAGYLLGPVLAVGAYTKLSNTDIAINRNLQKAMQIGIGGLIGLSATRESILSIPDYVLPIICLNVLIVGGSLLFGYLLHKMTGWDLPTCLLSTAPAGLSPMIALSMELNADSSRVIIFQLLRLSTVVLFAPLAGHLLLE